MKVLILLIALVLGLTDSKHANNVHLIGNTAYMISFFQELVSELEEKGWWNLKVPIITNEVNEMVLDRDFNGTVTYSNGFLESMQLVDMLQRGLNQIWTWNNTDATGSVRQTGILRMLDVVLGYDVVADLNDGRHHYTVTVTYPENHFEFDVRTNVNTGAVDITVNSKIITVAKVESVNFLPIDSTSDVLTTMFNLKLPEEGIKNWGDEVLVPIAYNVYHNKVEFPRICYDCPLTAT